MSSMTPIPHPEDIVDRLARDEKNWADVEREAGVPVKHQTTLERGEVRELLDLIVQLCAENASLKEQDLLYGQTRLQAAKLLAENGRLREGLRGAEPFVQQFADGPATVLRGRRYYELPSGQWSAANELANLRALLSETDR